MPRFFNPEDNPWGIFDTGTTWQQIVSTGNAKRLSRNWNFNRTSYRQGLSESVLNCQSADDFIALANINFLDLPSLCLLSPAEIELAWLLFCHYVKDNLITLTDQGVMKFISGQGAIDLDGSLDFQNDTISRYGGESMILQWPTVGQLTTLEEIRQGYKQKRWDSIGRGAVDNFLIEYINYLAETEQSHRITEIFSSPLEIRLGSGEIAVGLIVANKTALRYIEEDANNDIYSFFLTTFSGNYYGQAPTIISQLQNMTSNSNSELFGEYIGDGEEAFISEVQEVIQDLNSQISAFIDECPLDLASLCTEWFGGLKPEFSIADRQSNLTTITGPASDIAMQYLNTLKDVYTELITPGINFVGTTASDIPLGWSYPITEGDISNMYYPNSSRGTNLRTLHSQQKAVPTINLSLEDIENLQTVFSAIQALQSKLPRLDKSIQDGKRRLEQARAKLVDLQDVEITRQQVNQAARAARAQVRERIARNITNTEYNIQSNLDNLDRLQSEKRDLIRQYLNE
jgi:hypothetical protein